MINFHKNHQQLLITITLVFFGLSLLVAILPAYQMQENVEPLPKDSAMTTAERKGLEIYISEGCVACHTQQVRKIGVDKTWGDRPSLPSDYHYSKQRLDVWRQSPSLLGSERTGPDLSNIGERQPSENWHLLHLFNPRIVEEQSIMPAYPWLFTYKENPDDNAATIQVPDRFKNGKGKVVVTEKAKNLVAYLTTLKQAPANVQDTAFISFGGGSSGNEEGAGNNDDNESSAEPQQLDGKKLYQNHCAQCHQANGQGVPGAFPSLVNSDIINQEDPEKMVSIILQGYNERSEYGQMPPFGSKLSDKEVAAIANHERSSWGHNAPEISAEKVAEIRASIEEMNP